MFSEVLSMRISNEWTNYECIDAGNGEKLERWGNVILRRPEPLAMWPIEIDKSWKNVDGVYYRFVDGGGHWEFNKKLPDFWTIEYKDLKFKHITREIISRILYIKIEILKKLGRY